MRPHVEFVHEEDLVWHAAEVSGARGRAVQRHLSLDEEDGSASLRIDFQTDFERPAGIAGASFEWFVLEGEIEIGTATLGKGGYFRIDRGKRLPRITARQGARTLVFREGGLDELIPDGSDPQEEREVTIIDSSRRRWQPILSQGVPTGVLIKPLFADAASGRFSGLTWAKAGWTDARYTHHDVFEEGYTLSGRMSYNFGELVGGTYFFRPPSILHGQFVSHQPDGCRWFLRGGGTLTSWFTERPALTMSGEAVNYDWESAPPMPAAGPVRSSSAATGYHLGLDVSNRS